MIKYNTYLSFLADSTHIAPVNQAAITNAGSLRKNNKISQITSYKTK